MNISDFVEVGKILPIDKSKIIFYKGGRLDGFFDGEKLIREEGLSYHIISSRKMYVEIEGQVQLRVGSEITLYPSCDKSFATCIGKFNNAINFRGEPFIGEEYG